MEKVKVNVGSIVTLEGEGNNTLIHIPNGDCLHIYSDGDYTSLSLFTEKGGVITKNTSQGLFAKCNSISMVNLSVDVHTEMDYSEEEEHSAEEEK